MQKPVQVLVVPADPSKAATAPVIAATVSELQDLVGGYFEGFPGADQTWHLYINEEARLKGLPLNERACALLVDLIPGFGTPLLGDIVFIGTSGNDDGNEANVPENVLAGARAAGLIS